MTLRTPPAPWNDIRDRTTDTLIVKHRRLRSDALRVLDLLYELEWRGPDLTECPMCEGGTTSGHNEGCELAAAIKLLEAVKP